MNIDSPDHLPIGTLVMMRDRKRGTVEFMSLETGEPVYLVRLKDRSERTVKAGELVRAKSYAKFVAPGSDWDGDEMRIEDRRVGELRIGERRSPARAGPTNQRTSKEREAQANAGVGA